MRTRAEADLQRHLESTRATRRAYRELLFTTPGIEKSVSGVILYSETIPKSAQDGTPFLKLLTDQGILPGINLDAETADLPGFPGERVTQGSEGLRARMREYRTHGVRSNEADGPFQQPG